MIEDEQAVGNVSLDELLVRRQIRAIISGTAYVVGGDDPLGTEAHLYRKIAINCQRKPELAAALAATSKKMGAETPQRNKRPVRLVKG
jgi:hypothetical protein